MSHTYGKSAHLLTARVQVLLLDCFSLKDLPSPKAIPRLGKNDKKQRSRSGAAALLGQIVLNKSSVSDGMLSSQLTHLHPDQSLCIVRKLEKVSTSDWLQNKGKHFKNSSEKRSQISCSRHTQLKHSKYHSIICQHIKSVPPNDQYP